LKKAQREAEQAKFVAERRRKNIDVQLRVFRDVLSEVEEIT
jgi:hypothetical protein